MLLSKIFPVDKDQDIRNIMFDSRKPCADSIFFAMKGRLNDGHKFIDKAIENGALCIVYSDDIEKKAEQVTYLQCEDVQAAYVTFCRLFYGDPLNQMKVIGITGTNGKTTIAWTIRQLIAHFEKCGYLGTRGYSLDGEIRDSYLSLTTPKSDELFRIGKQMLDYGCKSLVLEASSEGLFYHRLDQVEFTSAVFNNLTIEHFDIHGTMEDYFAAKCLLFDKLKEDGKAIINIDDEYGQRLADREKRRLVSYAINTAADYQATDIKLYPDHCSFILHHDGKEYPITTNMVALFNIYNLLAVIAVLNENGYCIESILPYLEHIELTEGRCQMIDGGQDFNVIVDYAFTTNSFKKVFDYAESITDKDKRIIAVFGAAGDRDHMRRPGTASVADERADIVILTHDDPATEDMMEILKDLRTYFKKLEPQIIFDREEAIQKAVDIAQEGDTILLLGKGDDKFFIMSDYRKPYISDEKAALNAISNKLQQNS